MSDHERGPYTPPSERLSFDPREPVRSGGPAPVTLIVSALILVGIVAGVVFLYKDGFRHRSDGPATVGAPVNQLGAPAAPDANAAPAGLTIDKYDNSTVPPVASAAPPAAALPAAAPPAPVSIATGPAPAPAAAPPPAQPAATAATPPARPPKPLTIASLADDAVSHGRTPLRPAITAEPAAPAAGGAWAQIGAFSTSALANKGWTEIAQFDRADMAGKGRQVTPTTRGGATFYRTIVTGFSSHAAAVAFCAKLTAAHKPCITR